MSEVLVFKVFIEGLENKIERDIAINDAKNVADLAYTILASFNSLAYHQYEINHNGIIYNCGADDDFFEGEDATSTKLRKLKLELNEEMVMEYDFGSTTTFIIKLIDKLEFKNGDGNRYPKILAGKGNGMLDDISSEELIEIVEETDRSGKSEHYYTPGYEVDEIYDYRVYDLENDNGYLRSNFWEIKYGYEPDLD